RGNSHALFEAPGVSFLPVDLEFLPWWNFEPLVLTILKGQDDTVGRIDLPNLAGYSLHGCHDSRGGGRDCLLLNLHSNFRAVNIDGLPVNHERYAVRYVVEVSERTILHFHNRAIAIEIDNFAAVDLDRFDGFTCGLGLRGLYLRCRWQAKD